MNVVIEKRKNFDAIIERDVISVQNIDFFDIAIDKNSDENFEKIIDNSIIDFDDTFFERSRTNSDTNIEKDKTFDNVENEKIIDRNDEKNDEIKKINDFDSKTNETTNSTNC